MRFKQFPSSHEWQDYTYTAARVPHCHSFTWPPDCCDCTFAFEILILCLTSSSGWAPHSRLLGILVWQHGRLCICVWSCLKLTRFTSSSWRTYSRLSALFSWASSCVYDGPCLWLCISDALKTHMLHVHVLQAERLLTSSCAHLNRAFQGCLKFTRLSSSSSWSTYSRLTAFRLSPPFFHVFLLSFLLPLTP